MKYNRYRHFTDSRPRAGVSVDDLVDLRLAIELILRVDARCDVVKRARHARDRPERRERSVARVHRDRDQVGAEQIVQIDRSVVDNVHGARNRILINLRRGESEGEKSKVLNVLFFVTLVFLSFGSMFCQVRLEARAANEARGAGGFRGGRDDDVLDDGRHGHAAVLADGDGGRGHGGVGRLLNDHDVGGRDLGRV